MCDINRTSNTGEEEERWIFLVSQKVKAIMNIVYLPNPSDPRVGPSMNSRIDARIPGEGARKECVASSMQVAKVLVAII